MGSANCNLFVQNSVILILVKARCNMQMWLNTINLNSGEVRRATTAAYQRRIVIIIEIEHCPGKGCGKDCSTSRLPQDIFYFPRLASSNIIQHVAILAEFIEYHEWTSIYIKLLAHLSTPILCVAWDLADILYLLSLCETAPGLQGKGRGGGKEK